MQSATTTPSLEELVDQQVAAFTREARKHKHLNRLFWAASSVISLLIAIGANTSLIGPDAVSLLGVALPMATA